MSHRSPILNRIMTPTLGLLESQQQVIRSKHRFGVTLLLKILKMLLARNNVVVGISKIRDCDIFLRA